MKTYQIIVDFITSFIITSGGALSVALVVASGAPLSKGAIWLIIATGLVTAARGTRALVSLPPLSNGNYESIKEVLAKSKSGTGNTDIIIK